YISETSTFKLSPTERVTQKVNFAELAAIVQNQEIDLDFPITVTQKLQKDFGDIMNKISVNKEKNSSWKLTVKNLSDIN
ncbi:MAG: ribonuclease D, partial [Okeania sp. SIO2D1]|nr:ribonuclease D [Okeania sp. SIO2D1]